MPNKLENETSLYLLQHAHQLVAWFAWGEEALALAKALNRPILLSIGYSACHWCQTMSHESFEDEEVASLMNTHFINIKVDREERPDIDQIYQTAHNLLTQKSGGWPLTVFLTPDQQPYFTGAYFPKEARYQLPGLIDLLPRVAAYYYAHLAEIANQTQQLQRGMARTSPLANRLVTADRTHIQEAFEQLVERFDVEYGGFDGAPKFANSPDLTALMHQAHIGDRQAEAMVLQALTSIANGGIYDQVAGGFFRYAVDERWQIPHFEKMLYDNGQLISLYTAGWQMSRDVRYQTVVEQTITWLRSEMRLPQGAFCSALAADSLDPYGKLTEGAYYTWQRDEVEALLTQEEFAVISQCFGFDQAANIDNYAWHPYLVASPIDDTQLLFNRVQEKLYAARLKRSQPIRDNKVVTAWNALTIKGLAHAGRVFNRPDWIALAKSAVDFIRATLWHDDVLWSTYQSGQVKFKAYLDDYAFLIDALLELMQADYRLIDQVFSQQLADTLIAQFEAEEGGFYYTAHQHELLIHRLKQGYDNPMPNGNGVAAVALQRLGHLLSEPRYLNAAERVLQAFDHLIKRNPASCPTLTHALNEYYIPPTVVVVTGPQQQLAAWAQEIAQRYYPHHLFFYLNETICNAPDTFVRLPKILQKKTANTVNAVIYKGVECSRGIDNLTGLLNQL